MEVHASIATDQTLNYYVRYPIVQVTTPRRNRPSVSPEQRCRWQSGVIRIKSNILSYLVCTMDLILTTFFTLAVVTGIAPVMSTLLVSAPSTVERRAPSSTSTVLPTATTQAARAPAPKCTRIGKKPKGCRDQPNEPKTGTSRRSSRRLEKRFIVSTSLPVKQGHTDSASPAALPNPANRFGGAHSWLGVESRNAKTHVSETVRNDFVKASSKQLIGVKGGNCDQHVVGGGVLYKCCKVLERRAR